MTDDLSVAIVELRKRCNVMITDINRTGRPDVPLIDVNRVLRACDKVFEAMDAVTRLEWARLDLGPRKDLRDKFAMAALAGFNSDALRQGLAFHHIAADCYRTADAMMVERDK